MDFSSTLIYFDVIYLRLKNLTLAPGLLTMDVTFFLNLFLTYIIYSLGRAILGKEL